MPRRSVTRKVVDRAFRNIAAPGVATSPLALATEQEIEREFLAGPPLTLHSGLPAVYAGVWGALRESFLAGPVDRAAREIVAAAVSSINRCPFCVDSHTAAAGAFGAVDAAVAVRAGALDDVGNDLGAIASWAAATASPDDPILRSRPFGPDDAVYFVGTALMFHYINRMVSAFLKPWPVPVPVFLGNRWITRINTIFPGKLLAAPAVESHVSVREAWETFSTGVDEAGASVLSDAARGALKATISAWRGEAPTLGARWRDDAVAALPEDERAAAGFALTCALAAYRVDAPLIASVRRSHPSDPQLVAIAAWGSLQATLQIASWL